MELSDVQQISDLKDEIFRLKSENSELRTECIKWQKIAQSNLTAQSLDEATVSNLRFEGIFNKIPVMITIYDPQIQNFKFNDELKRILGWTEEDASRGNFIEKVYPDPNYRQSVIDFMKTLQPGWREFEMTAKDGTKVHSSWANIYLSSGIQIGIGVDIRERKKTENQLKKSEELFRTLADNIAPLVWMANEDGTIFWYNKRWYEYTGLTPEEVQGDGWIKVHHPDYAGRVLEGYRRAIQSGTRWEDTFPLRSKDGSYKWYLSRAMPIHKEGKIIRWFGTNTDITEQRKTEEALRKNEQRLQAIFNNVAMGIVEVDNEDRFIYVNERICQILGYTKEELIGKTIFEITAPEDLGISEVQNKSLHSGSFDILNYEKRYIKKDGKKIWVHVSVAAIRDKDKLTSIGTVEDISHRKQMEQNLIESEEKFRLLFENVTEGIALHDVVYENDRPVNYRITDVNPAYVCYCGIDEKSAVGSLATDLYKTDLPPYFERYVNVAETREPVRFESFFPALNKHFIISAISPKKGHFATVFEDITEQKRVEAEIKQKNEELTRFIYTVSHDLKSPLVTIKSFSSFLRSDIESSDTEALERDIKYIQNAADKMAKLLDELLELSRIGRKEDEKEEIPLDTIAHMALDLVAGRIKEVNAEVRVTGPKVMVYGYCQRLIQLYQNLLDNAAKFMGNQPNPLIEVGTLMDWEKGNRIVFFVRDNGSGIDPRYHHKIFGLFEKLDVNSEGTGIGLSLTKRIVEVHGGSIWFTSEGAGKGTTFYFTLEKSYLL